MKCEKKKGKSPLPHVLRYTLDKKLFQTSQ